MLMGVVLLVVGGILSLIAVGHKDEERRARGRGRANRILTDYGGGSFSEGITSMLSEWTHGCLSQVIFLVGLACLLLSFKSCFCDHGETKPSVTPQVDESH